MARWQLEAAGLRRGAVEHRLRAKRLHPIHRGVYAVGHELLSWHGRVLAAVLAHGPGAVASHRTAAALWHLLSDDYGAVHVTATAGRRSRRGIKAHHSCSLTALETVEVEGIPATSAHRTLLDIATSEPRRLLARAVDQADHWQLLDMNQIAELRRRAPNHKGWRALGAALTVHRPGTTLTASELEDLMLDLVREAGLPRPITNYHLPIPGHRFYADFFFPEYRLVVEADAYSTHLSRASFVGDRERDRIVALAGYTTLRFADSEIALHPRRVAEALIAWTCGRIAVRPPVG